MEPIRILQVVTRMDRGGLETMLMNYYRHIDKEKVQFDFLTHRADDGAYGDEIRALGGRIYHLSRLNPLSVQYRHALCSFFEKHPDYRIVHVHQDCMSSVILKEAAAQGVPVRIAHSHSSNQNKNMKYPVKLFYRRSIPRYATELMACSRMAGKWMFCRAPFKVLANAIETDMFRYHRERRIQIRSELGIDMNGMVFGHVGVFRREKNHTFLLELFREILKKSPDALLLLVGDGETRNETEQQAFQFGISESVQFLGVRADVDRILQAMDCFVLPSLYEGLPVTLVEAQTSGLPCVISDRVPEESILVDDLVSVRSLRDSPEVWAEAALAAAEQLRRDRSREVAAAGYDIRETARWLEAFYISHDGGVGQST